MESEGLKYWEQKLQCSNPAVFEDRGRQSSGILGFHSPWGRSFGMGALEKPLDLSIAAFALKRMEFDSQLRFGLPGQFFKHHTRIHQTLSSVFQ
jgi:hypothetical protein